MAEDKKEASEDQSKINEKKPKEPFWTQDFVKYLIPHLEEFFGKYATFKKDTTEAENRLIELKSQHNRRLTFILLGFLAITIIAMSVLVFFKMVSGDSLLFAVGTIFGYVLSMVQKLIYPADLDAPIQQDAT
jgi:hypothetical protein